MAVERPSNRSRIAVVKKQMLLAVTCRVSNCSATGEAAVGRGSDGRKAVDDDAEAEAGGRASEERGDAVAADVTAARWRRSPAVRVTDSQSFSSRWRRLQRAFLI